MTHDELLNAVNWPVELAEAQYLQELLNQMKALRAVVELHKPEVEDESFLVCSMCMDGDYTDGTHSYSRYPCETIEAIEKELR